jgi:hypothetical protein
MPALLTNVFLKQMTTQEIHDLLVAKGFKKKTAAEMTPASPNAESSANRGLEGK